MAGSYICDVLHGGWKKTDCGSHSLALLLLGKEERKAAGMVMCS